MIGMFRLTRMTTRHFALGILASSSFLFCKMARKLVLESSHFWLAVKPIEKC